MKNFKIGQTALIKGRFVPENQMENVIKNKLIINYPPVTLKGVIKIVLDNSCVIEFTDIDLEMEILNEDIFVPIKRQLKLINERR